MNRDPTEDTKEFKEAMKRIQPELDILSQQLHEQRYRLGNCHIYWQEKNNC